MDLYTKTCYELSRRLTLNYSTSFSKSSKLFNKDIQKHIFAVYGLVRIADEVVDTYSQESGIKTPEVESILNQLETNTYEAIQLQYSTNPIIHAFALTAAKYAFPKKLIKAFFESMRMDLTPTTFTQTKYETYIYGSAEVIGLMCLKVFCNNDTALYSRLEPGAKALGSAYQKVNFLRDIASDYQEKGRVYFPGVTFDTFSEAEKQAIIQDIRNDFHDAQAAIQQLPVSARKAVSLSYTYYSELLRKLENTSVEKIKTSRVRVSDLTKTTLLVRSSLRNKKGQS